MPHKTCQCGKQLGPRTRICPNCQFDFQTKVAAKLTATPKTKPAPTASPSWSGAKGKEVVAAPGKGMCGNFTSICPYEPTEISYDALRLWVEETQEHFHPNRWYAPSAFKNLLQHIEARRAHRHEQPLAKTQDEQLPTDILNQIFYDLYGDNTDDLNHWKEVTKRRHADEAATKKLHQLLTSPTPPKEVSDQDILSDFLPNQEEDDTPPPDDDPDFLPHQ